MARSDSMQKFQIKKNHSDGDGHFETLPKTKTDISSITQTTVGIPYSIQFTFISSKNYSPKSEINLKSKLNSIGFGLISETKFFACLSSLYLHNSFEDDFTYIHSLFLYRKIRNDFLFYFFFCNIVTGKYLFFMFVDVRSNVVQLIAILKNRRIENGKLINYSQFFFVPSLAHTQHLCSAIFLSECTVNWVYRLQKRHLAQIHGKDKHSSTNTLTDVNITYGRTLSKRSKWLVFCCANEFKAK